MTTPSRFIVLEGLDGVGKSTLARDLAAHLDAQLMSTPGEVFRGVRGQVLEAFGNDQLAKALFYTATVSNEGIKAQAIVDQGRSVVMDRYWASTVAYARARGVSANLDALESALVAPDITVLISLNRATRLTRLHQRGMNAEDRETLSPLFEKTVLLELEARSSLTVDISGLDEACAVSRVASAIADYFDGATSRKGLHS